MEINNPQPLHGLYGSQISRTKAVGYCRYHNVALTTRTLKKHECLKKQCDALKKYEEHSYWTQREVLKSRKKNNKKGELN